MTPRREWWHAAALVALALLIYGFDLGRGLYFDDTAYITDNALLRTREPWRVFWFSTEPFNYYPVFWSLLWLQWQAWGDAAMGYHAVNLLLHAVNALLVWQLARLWRLPGAWWIAALFAVHPLHVQTLAWAAEQKNTWSFCFMALATLAFVRHLRTGWRGSYLGALGLFATALGCKTSVVALPIFLGLAYGWRDGRLQRGVLVKVAPMLLLGVAAGVATLWFEQHRVQAHSLVGTLDHWQRTEAAAATLWAYFGKVLAPIALTPFYAGWSDATAAAHSAWPLVLLFLAAVVLALAWRRIGAPCALGLAFFALMLLPLLGLFDTNYFVYSRLADHWTYHALPGVLVAIVALLHRLASRSLPWIGASAVAVLSLASSVHLGHFADERTLWTHVTRGNPGAWMAWHNLGNVHAAVGEWPQAMAAFEQALRVRPDYFRAQFNLANTLAATGRLEAADRAWISAMRMSPLDAGAAANRGALLLQLNRDDLAFDCLQHALECDPDHLPAHINLMALHLSRGEVAAALRHLPAVRAAGDADRLRVIRALERSRLAGRISAADLRHFAELAAAQ